MIGSDLTMSEHEVDTDSGVKEVTILECRTCLEVMPTDSDLFNIFESWNPPWDGMQNTIAEDLTTLANVQIQQSDRHSKVICKTCCQLLHTACTFRNAARQCDQIFQQRYPPDQEEADKVWPKPIQVDKSINSSMQENSMNVEIKQEALSDDDYEPMNGSYENGEDFLNLDIKVEPEEMIQQQFTIVKRPLVVDQLTDEVSHLTNGDSGEHLEQIIKEEPVSEEDTEQVLSDLPLECLLCAKDFNSISGLKAHVIAQHSYKSVKRKSNNSMSPERNKCNYVCAICRRNFTTSTDLMVHETCHNKSVCYGCNESFDTFEQVTKHRQSCKAITSQEVKKLKTLDDVLRPQVQEQVNRLKCTLCDETFTDMYYVTIHQEIHHSAPSEKSEYKEDTTAHADALESIFSDSSNS